MFGGLLSIWLCAFILAVEAAPADKSNLACRKCPKLLFNHFGFENNVLKKIEIMENNTVDEHGCSVKTLSCKANINKYHYLAGFDSGGRIIKGTLGLGEVTWTKFSCNEKGKWTNEWGEIAAVSCFVK